MAPVVRAFQEKPEVFETLICVTGQHREMLDQVLQFFEITPDFDLDIMKDNQGLNELTARLLVALEKVLSEVCPDYVFVHGDTTTAMVASLASYYQQLPVCHVEAGLRTYNKYAPFPEEINRQFIGKLATYHFSPTSLSKQNLTKEMIAPTSITVTGNTVIDALYYSVAKVSHNPSATARELSAQIGDRRLVLVTGHRRENHGEGFQRICNALSKIATSFEDVVVVYPVHLNPNVLDVVQEKLSGYENVLLTPPLSYPDFVWIMNRSYLIITDSGGIQEEAPSLGKPVLVMRESTERPEALEAKTVALVGTDEELIVQRATQLLTDENFYRNISGKINPYGDGLAAKRIVEFMEQLPKK